MKWPLLICILFSTAFYGCKKDKTPTPSIPPVTTPPNNYISDQSFKIVAYFPSYRNPDSVNTNKYKMITHLYYAFLTPTTTGSLNTLPETGRFTRVISEARANGVKVGIALSGASSTYVTLAANPSSRTNLVKNVLSFVKQYNLDGVDMDWEYPRSNDGSDITYSALMKELSDTLHNNNKYLSAAITPGLYSGAVRDGIKSDVFAYADFFNIMVYDGKGWDSSDPKQHSSYKMAVTSFDYWSGCGDFQKQKLF